MTTTSLITLDPHHITFSWAEDPFVKEIWKTKYAQPKEASIIQTFHRVANAISLGDEKLGSRFAEAMKLGVWMPGGRILAGAGTSKRVTLMNCYVSRTIEDNMEEIMQAHTDAALTMQQGGGIGMDFSTIRPRNAILRRTGSKASGPLHFMDMWDAMCKAIRSAGDRRGAMMGTLSDTHPDLPEFITAKRTKGRLTQFNVSILISDAFMDAVENDQDWYLHFAEEPFERTSGLEACDWVDDNGIKQYVYSIWKARDLWKMVLENTYTYAEPGIIFIDQINDSNNLKYCEAIRATNPCGEQPLPPFGTCNLGAINLARLVKNPFTPRAYIDYEEIKILASLGIDFLDNVIEVTNYPLKEQEKEEKDKRRLGLGLSGLADLFAQMQIPYGSLEAGNLAEQIQKTIALAAYRRSMELAKLKGPYPLWDFAAIEKDPDNFINKRIKQADPELYDDIKKYGLRNGVILTIAPTGTTTITFGNWASGCEPAFAYTQIRNVRQDDDTYKPYAITMAGSRFYLHCKGIDPSKAAIQMEDGSFDIYKLPEYMQEVKDLSVIDHIRIQSNLQKWVDASISKTVNCPADMTFDDFVEVYNMAYKSGCKGCTTYRPSDVRGSILETVNKVKKSEGRPKQLEGTTYKVKWPTMSAAMYITINDFDGKPYEMFFASKDARHSDWMTALTLMISSILRTEVNPSFIPHELRQITSMHDTAWIDGKFYASPVAYIAHVIETHLTKNVINEKVEDIITIKTNKKSNPKITGIACPSCGAPSLMIKEGCRFCENCNYSQCG